MSSSEEDSKESSLREEYSARLLDTMGALPSRTRASRWPPRPQPQPRNAEAFDGLGSLNPRTRSRFFEESVTFEESIDPVPPASVSESKTDTSELHDLALFLSQQLQDHPELQHLSANQLVVAIKSTDFASVATKTPASKLRPRNIAASKPPDVSPLTAPNGSVRPKGIRQSAAASHHGGK